MLGNIQARNTRHYMNTDWRIRDHWEAAAWWRKESKISAIPEQHLQFAANLEALTCHMIAHTELYLDRGEFTDWQIFKRCTEGTR